MTQIFADDVQSMRCEAGPVLMVEWRMSDGSVLPLRLSTKAIQTLANISNLKLAELFQQCKALNEANRFDLKPFLLNPIPAEAAAAETTADGRGVALSLLPDSPLYSKFPMLFALSPELAEQLLGQLKDATGACRPRATARH